MKRIHCQRESHHDVDTSIDDHCLAWHRGCGKGRDAQVTRNGWLHQVGDTPPECLHGHQQAGDDANTNGGLRLEQ